ncbi:7930_t:CDS:2 [Entrophospora sp. SA101]|nr:7930_t:CDS:2 [Entrophospora sp. SA101]CAJ0919127.1 493_t:CDS:2 [Entrophospora sp. SA101]
MELEYLQELNEQQKQAVYEKHHRVCVIAGPGCGKTKTLVSKAIYLLASQQAQPENILILTFAKKAIKEVRKRIFSAITNISPKKLHIYNFHSFCFRVLNKHSHLLGFPDSKFPVYDRQEQEVIVRKIISQNNYNCDQKEYLIVNKTLDFNDLLLYTITLFTYHPPVRKEYQAQFTHILLDEFQDINAIQWEVIKLILSDQQKTQGLKANLTTRLSLRSRIEQELVAQKIPYEILGSFKFIEREEIKDVLAFCRTIIYQDNISLLRILGLQEKIGVRTIEKIEQSSEKEGASIYHYLNNFTTSTNSSQENTSNAKLAAGQLEKITEFVSKDKKLLKTRNNLILSSVHQAKGLEFEVVFFVYLDHGTLPYRDTQDLTEERRLFYVGITRAKRLLYLVSSKELYSPFLDELDKKYLESK